MKNAAVGVLRYGWALRTAELNPVITPHFAASKWLWAQQEMEWSPISLHTHFLWRVDPLRLLGESFSLTLLVGGCVRKHARGGVSLVPSVSCAGADSGSHP